MWLALTRPELKQVVIMMSEKMRHKIRSSNWARINHDRTITVGIYLLSKFGRKCVMSNFGRNISFVEIWPEMCVMSNFGRSTIFTGIQYSRPPRTLSKSWTGTGTGTRAVNHKRGDATPLPRSYELTAHARAHVPAHVNFGFKLFLSARATS